VFLRISSPQSQFLSSVRSHQCLCSIKRGHVAKTVSRIIFPHTVPGIVLKQPYRSCTTISLTICSLKLMEITFLKICSKLKNHYVSITKTDPLMSFNVVMGVYSENHMTHEYSLLAEFSVFWRWPMTSKYITGPSHHLRRAVLLQVLTIT
jgi:hypothetical protein